MTRAGHSGVLFRFPILFLAYLCFPSTHLNGKKRFKHPVLPKTAYTVQLEHMHFWCDVWCNRSTISTGPPKIWNGCWNTMPYHKVIRINIFHIGHNVQNSLIFPTKMKSSKIENKTNQLGKTTDRSSKRTLEWDTWNQSSGYRNFDTLLSQYCFYSLCYRWLT